jgi:hypothetical protein
MVGDSSDILGIEIPSTDPIFIAVIVGIHIPLGLACVGAGAVAMLARNAGPLFGGPRLLALDISGLPRAHSGSRLDSKRTGRQRASRSCEAMDPHPKSALRTHLCQLSTGLRHAEMEIEKWRAERGASCDAWL